MDSDNVAKLRRVYASWHETRGGSVQEWLDVMDDGVVLRSLPEGAPEMAFTARRESKAAAEVYFSGLAADWEMLHFTPTDFIEQGDRVVVLSEVAFKFRATGKEVHSLKADVFTFRGGLVVEATEYFDTARAFAATRPG